jgi:hypothetical protein
MDLFLVIRNHAQDESAPICDAQFSVDAMQVSFHRAFAHPKLNRHNLIRAPL